MSLIPDSSILEDPVKRALIYSYAEKIGISPIKIEALRLKKGRYNNQNISNDVSNIRESQVSLSENLPNEGLGIGEGIVRGVSQTNS